MVHASPNRPLHYEYINIPLHTGTLWVPLRVNVLPVVLPEVA